MVRIRVYVIAIVIGITAAGVAQAVPTAQDPHARVIVTLAPGTDAAAAAEAATARGGVLTHVFHHGFSAILPSPVISALRSRSDVIDIEADQRVWAAACQAQTLAASSWGLSRIVRRNLPNDFVFEWNPSRGADVNVYVLDTGIDTDHPDFGGRAVWGVDVIDGSQDECNGHGTAVAGTIGGTTYGVNKQVSLTAVRVLDCRGVGFVSDVVAGLEWATDDYLNSGIRSIAVLALEGPFSKSLNAAVDAAYQAGLGSIVAAGNDHADACNYSPASAASAITVAAMDITDRRASFSNGGACVDIFAPGVDITSDWLDGQTRSFSGTSISAAFVASVAVETLAEPGGPTSFDALKVRLFGDSTPNAISQTSNDCAKTGPPALRCAPLSPNRLLFHACLDD